MWGMAGPLTDKQIQELADYFAKQTPVKVINKNANDPKLARGKEIFEKGIPAQGVIQCNSCHGPKGDGMATFPKISGQHAYYLIQQLNVWKEPAQKEFMEVGGNTWAPRKIKFARPHGVLMINEEKNLSEADIEAVALYLSVLE
jgi:cytochrome c553